MFAVATTTGLVLSARLLDRVGKGIRGAPRDALIADLAPPGLRGAAYGLRQSLDKVGALLGPLLAVGLMLLWHNDFRAIFWVALVPAFMSVGLLIIGIREPSRPKDAEQVNPIKRVNLKRLNREYWWVVGIGGVFALARFSEAFLVLRAAQTGIPLAWVPMVMVCMSILYAMTAYPFGKLSDVMNRKTMLIIGLIVLIAADVVLASDGHWWTVLVGVALWGIHMGITQGLLSTLVASVTAGLIWDQFGASYTFVAGAVFALLAITGVLAWRQPAMRAP